MEIKQRLRHRSDSSMRRYQKAARAQAELAKMPAGSRRFGLAVGERLEGIFCSGEAVPPLP